MLKYLKLIIGLLFCGCGGTGETNEATFIVKVKHEYNEPANEDPLTTEFETHYTLRIWIRKATGEWEVFYAVSCTKKVFDLVEVDGRYRGIFQSYWKYRAGGPDIPSKAIWYVRLLEFKGKA